MRPRAKMGRALPYQSTHEARQLSFVPFDLAASLPSSLRCSESFFKNEIEAEPLKRCSYPSRPARLTGSPKNVDVREHDCQSKKRHRDRQKSARMLKCIAEVGLDGHGRFEV